MNGKVPRSHGRRVRSIDLSRRPPAGFRVEVRKLGYSTTLTRYFDSWTKARGFYKSMRDSHQITHLVFSERDHGGTWREQDRAYVPTSRLREELRQWRLDVPSHVRSPGLHAGPAARTSRRRAG